MKTKIVTNEDFKGSKMFKVYELKEDGTTKDYPMVSIGKKKLGILLNNIEEAKEFVNETD